MERQQRSQYLRPARLALLLIAIGEFNYFVAWGLWLFPDGNPLFKLVWTSVCSIAMAAVIGMLVIEFVTDRLTGPVAATGAFIIYTGILSAYTMLCFALDSRTNYFGGASAPTLFIASGLVPAVLSGFLYVWLLYSPRGQTVLTQLKM